MLGAVSRLHICIGIECVYAFCASAQKQKLFCSARNKRHRAAWGGQYMHLYMANYRNCDVWIRIILLLIVSTYAATHSRRLLPSRWVEMARTRRSATTAATTTTTKNPTKH